MMDKSIGISDTNKLIHHRSNIYIYNSIMNPFTEFLVCAHGMSYTMATESWCLTPHLHFSYVYMTDSRIFEIILKIILTVQSLVLSMLLLCPYYS